MEMSRQHFMAMCNYLNKAAGVVPVTMAEGIVLSPLFEAIKGVADGQLECTFDPVEQPQTKKETD